MRLRLLTGAALAVLIVVPALRAEDKPPARAVDAKNKPTVVIRLGSLDSLMADARYLVSLAGKDEEAKQAEAMLKAMAGENGLEGIDTTRPIGLYGKLVRGITESNFALMIPVADEKAVLALLDRVGAKGEKGENDIYKVAIPRSPVPGFYRFANMYLYFSAMSADNLAKEKLLSPEAIFPPGATGTFSVTVNLDQVDDAQKDLALSFLSLRVAEYKSKTLPGETAAQFKFRTALVEDTLAQSQTFLKEGQTLTLKMDVDRKKGEIVGALSLTAKPGSTCAEEIAGLNKRKSVAASLTSADAAVNGVIHFALADKLRKMFEPVVDEGVDLLLKKEKDEAKRQLMEGILKSLAPTAKMAEFDGGMSVQGPSDNGLYTVLMGLKVKDGAGIEKAIKDLLEKLPGEVKDRVAMDADKAGGTSIHKITPENLDAKSKEVLGDNPIYFALRGDAFLLGAGDKGLSALKEALTATPKVSQPMRIDISLAKLAKLMARDNKTAPALAKKAFKDQDSDRIVILMEGGKVLRLSINIKGQVLQFFALLDEAKKKDL